MSVRSLTLALLLAGSLTGCALFNETEVAYSRHVSLGQELIDLKSALDQGAITAEEYARAKRAVLEHASAHDDD